MKRLVKKLPCGGRWRLGDAGLGRERDRQINGNRGKVGEKEGNKNGRGGTNERRGNVES